MSKNSSVSHFIYGLLLFVLFIGVFLLGQMSARNVGQPPQQHESRPASVKAPESPAKISEKEKIRPSTGVSPDVKFAEDSEDFLNGFLKELAQVTREYKLHRRIFKEVVDPFYLQGTENAEKAYSGFREEIAPALRAKAQDVVRVFEKAEKNFKKLIDSHEKDQSGKKLIAAWQDLKKAQMPALIAYLENDEKLIVAHEKLLKFYFVHSKLYSVDPEAGAIVFKNPKYQEEERRLVGEIEKLRHYGKKEG